VVTVGVATQASLRCLRVLDSTSSGSYSDILTAMAFIRDLESSRRATYRKQYGNASMSTFPAALMSMSFGGAYSTSLNSMTVSLVALGTHASVAMGNSGVAACGTGSNGFSPAAVADSSPVIAVGSSGATDVFSTFSNWGDCLTLTAPGENVLGAWPTASGANNTYALLSGTSMAAPLVSGAVASFIAQWPKSISRDVTTRQSWLTARLISHAHVQ